MMQTTNSSDDKLAVSEELRGFFRMHANLCKVLGNERRLAIIWLLGQGEMSVGELAEAMGTSIHNVSQHLRVMKERGVVRGEKRGQSVFHSLSNPKFVQGYSLIREALIEQHQYRERLVTGLIPLFPEQEASPQDD